MTIRAAIGLIGVSVALLNPVSASAHTRCNDRPLEGSLSAVIKLDAATGNLTGEATGVMTHLGRFTGHQQGHVVRTADGGFLGTSTFRLVAANGDTLRGTTTFTPDGPPTAVHTTTQILTVTGGTGRFTNASGQFTIVYHVTPVSFDGVTVINSAEGLISGRIRY
jgi:hypothetical protein